MEAALSLALLGLMLGLLLPPLSGQIALAQRRDNQQRLETIRDSVVGFALAQGRLPCPADPITNHGGEDCTRTHGVIPWADLSTPATDVWGHRFSYQVNAVFSDALAAQTFGAGCTPNPTPTQSSFALCSTGDITVHDENGKVLGQQIPFLVASHGQQSSGAWNSDGSRVSVSTGSAIEMENSNDDSLWVQTLSPLSDDQLIWVPAHWLVHQMLKAGKLP